MNNYTITIVNHDKPDIIKHITTGFSLSDLTKHLITNSGFSKFEIENKNKIYKMTPDLTIIRVGGKTYHIKLNSTGGYHDTQ